MNDLHHTKVFVMDGVPEDDDDDTRGNRESCLRMALRYFLRSVMGLINLLGLVKTETGGGALIRPPPFS